MAVLDSQQNWAEDTECFILSTLSTHSLPNVKSQSRWYIVIINAATVTDHSHLNSISSALMLYILWVLTNVLSYVSIIISYRMVSLP